MKSSRMKFAKKLKSMRAGEYLNQDRILQVLSAADGISEFLPKLSNPIPQITTGSIWKSPQKLEDRIVDVTEKDGEEASGNEENVRPPPVNQIPRVPCDRKESKPEISCGSDTGIGGRNSFGSEFGFRRPDLNSRTLFDPSLLEAFELAVVCFRRINDFSREAIRLDDDGEDVIAFPEIDKDENTLPPVTDVEVEEESSRKDENVLRNDAQQNEQCSRKDVNTLPVIEKEEEDSWKDENVLQKEEEDDTTLRIVNAITSEVGIVQKLIGEDDESGKDRSTISDPLSEFEERCPPGGEDSVVFYTTTLRGIRKTFDDCNKIRFLLDSFKVKYYERDVSMHREYREELRRISPDVLPPVLFVKGRCIGGAHRVIGLHEQGKLKVLFDGIPIVAAGDEKCCRRCGGFRFLMCGECRGSRRIAVAGDGGGSRIQCLLCNENGLIVCVDCSS